ncbi:Uncharacterised protein [Streptococcus pneumoniae]|nr:Uncharacterised protein [Streptococcus pneumoniae]
MNRCFGAILLPLNHQYCRSTTYRFLVSSLFLVQELVALVVVQELVALVVVQELVALVVVQELVLVHQLHPTIDPIQLEVHLALLEAFLICPYHLKYNSLLQPLHFVSQQDFSPLLRFYHQGLRFYFEEQR